MAQGLRTGTKKLREHKPKKTSQGSKASMIKFSSMNKNKKRNFKKYRGQGK
jgi:hypothetical protein